MAILKAKSHTPKSGDMSLKVEVNLVGGFSLEKEQNEAIKRLREDVQGLHPVQTAIGMFVLLLTSVEKPDLWRHGPSWTSAKSGQHAAKEPHGLSSDAPNISNSAGWRHPELQVVAVCSLVAIAKNWKPSV